MPYRLSSTKSITRPRIPPQFYDEAFTLLSRLLELLRGFMNRSHQALAAVGVAAFVRLAINAGKSGRWKGGEMRSCRELGEGVGVQ